jgi:hypothetical protein
VVKKMPLTVSKMDAEVNAKPVRFRKRSDSLKRTPRAERPGEMGLVDAS